jgi:hypothetical protein
MDWECLLAYIPGSVDGNYLPETNIWRRRTVFSEAYMVWKFDWRKKVAHGAGGGVEFATAWKE